MSWMLDSRIAIPGSERVIVRSETFLTEPEPAKTPFTKILTLDHFVLAEP